MNTEAKEHKQITPYPIRIDGWDMVRGENFAIAATVSWETGTVPPEFIIIVETEKHHLCVSDTALEKYLVYLTRQLLIVMGKDYKQWSGIIKANALTLVQEMDLKRLEYNS